MVRLTNVLGFYRTEAKRLSFRVPRGGEDWRRRFALTYAVSAWAMIGLVAYMQWQSKDTVKIAKTEEIVNDPHEESSQGRKQKIEFSAMIEYKEGHVPYTTRIYQYLTSFNKASDSGSAEK